MKEEIVSIIVPIFNVENYLEECIESIINQTYQQIEIILVNDGSTDESYKICKKYQKKDKRIKIVSKKNGGLSEARNYGIEKSIGDYIMFVDGDDIVSKYYVERMISTLKNTETDIVGTRYCRFKRREEIQTEKNLEIKVLDIKEFYELVFYQFDQTLYSVSACTKMYKRSVFENVRFPVGKLYEDVAIAGEIIDKCDKIALIDNKLYFYRINEKSITNSKFNNKRLDIILHLEQLLIKFQSDANLKKAINSMIFARSIELLAIMKKSKIKEKKVQSELWKNIIENRISVILNTKSRKIAKISAIISFLGKDILASLNNSYKNFKKKNNIQ